MIKSSTALADVLKEQIIMLSPIIDFFSCSESTKEGEGGNMIEAKK